MYKNLCELGWKRTPYAAREREKHAECHRIILYTRVRLDSPQDTDHDTENEDLPDRAHDKRNIRNTIAFQRLKTGVFVKADLGGESMAEVYTTKIVHTILIHVPFHLQKLEPPGDCGPGRGTRRPRT